MSCPGKKEHIVVGVLLSIALLLVGCSFGTSQNNANCDGGACDCANVYYGMEAGIYIAGAPIEHASLHVTVPRAEPDKANTTGCCVSLYHLRPVQEQGHNQQDANAKADFCKACAKSPNAELSKAAQSCPSPDSSFLVSSSATGSKHVSASDEDEDGSDAYSDCWYESTNNIPFTSGNVVTGVKSGFNIRWTDLKNSTDKLCCAAIQPLIRSLFFGKVTDSEKQDFCLKCKSAYNTGVGLAAFRSCHSASVAQKGHNVSEEPVLA